MRILAVSNPGVGHLNPMLPVMFTLQTRGHTVALVSAAAFQRYVKDFDFFPGGLDWLEADAEALFPELSKLELTARGDWMLHNVFADEAAHELLPDLEQICKVWEPDVLLRNDYEFASPIVAERLGLPLATVSVSLFWTAAALEQQIGDSLGYLRSVYGLPPYPAAAMLYQGPYFSYAPPRYQPSAGSFMHRLRLPDTTTHELPDWLSDLPDRLTVYVSMGTAFSKASGVFSIVLDALRDTDINLILTVGRRVDPAAFGPQPPNVRIEQYVPQDVLLSHCDVFVTHSPFYTQLSALARGVPLVMIPLTGDQPAHAARAVALGVGVALRLSGSQSPFLLADTPQLSVETLRNAVYQVLHEPHYKANAKELQREIAALPDISTSTAVFEQLRSARI
jgi:UDP:flavonoid glycosyltransferase YjiC (YdhE family)